MRTRAVYVALAASALSACAMLTAEAPLFAVADQDPAFAFAEGLWAAKEPDCNVDPARSHPERESCLSWARIARAPDGAWAVTLVGEKDGPLRLIVAAAAPRGSHPRAPLYVAETVNQKNGEIGYGALVPRGETEGPVKRLAVAGVSCDVTSGDYGEIDAITLTRDKDNKIVKCVATSQGAVREATRRTVIATLATIGDSELVFVRP
jgi:hypothetical protein